MDVGMTDVKEDDGEGGETFKWGKKRGVGKVNKAVQFYESFTFHGIKYSLYDCVHIFHEDATESYIGKIVRIFENSAGEKKMRLVWFFRPHEIRNCLGDYKPRWNEIFLASGRGEGLSNTNLLETIIRKCNVVCTSHDKRNPQATKEELEMSEFFFFCTFDVGKCQVLKSLPDDIMGIGVENFLNKRKERNNISSSIIQPKLGDLRVSKSAAGNLGAQRCVPSESSPSRSKNSVPCDGAGPSNTPLNLAIDKEKVRLQIGSSICRDELDVHPSKKRILPLDDQGRINSKRASPQPQQGRTVKQNVDSRCWFKALSWEERLQTAEEAGTLVFLENLDPSLTSSEVKDLVWYAFNERVEAKMLQRSTLSSPHYGEAFVIFKSKDAADAAKMKLQNRCLVLTDGRVVVGRKAKLQNHGKATAFTGHLKINSMRVSEEMRKGVATSHCAQPNTIECDMALDWRILQEKSVMWWQKLYQIQGKEIDEVRSRLKIKLDR